MIYKTYGKTGLKVSAVGFGGMRFDLKNSMEENAEIVRYACSKGINYFDTAPGYCEDKSEDIFGLAFKDMPNEFLVSTKGMPTNFDTKEKAKDAVKRSIERMGVDKLDFYHIWCLRKMDHYQLAMKDGGQYEGLLEMQQQGLIDHIVCSSHQPGDEIRQIVEDGKVEGVLMGINLLNFPYRWDGVLAALENDCGVVAMNPLGGGSIPSHHKELAFLAGEGETPTQAALRFIIAAPQISVGLVGFTTREHIDEACRIADNTKQFSEAELEDIRKHIGDNLNAACTGCGYCKNCPQDIPIPAYMQFYNEKQMFGVNDEEMKKKIDGERNWGSLVMRKAEAVECTECGICEEDCTQHLPIIERLAEIAKWEDGLE